MTEQYEDKLWGKIDFLHEYTIKEHTHLNIFYEIINKYQNALLDFSKSLDNIKNKNALIIEEKESTIDLTVKNFKEVLKSHIAEFRECGEHMKTTIITPIMQRSDDKYASEKDMYTHYNKTKNIYNNCKVNLEKSRKEFDSSAKLCEKNILNYVQMKNNALNASVDSSRSEERIKISITNTKNIEDKYYKHLEEANKARENEIRKQTDLLKFYQMMHTDFYLKINCVISYFIPMVKKMFASILLSLDALEERCKKIKIGDDINNFIEKNKTDLKPNKPILFVPYYPQVDLSAKSITGNDQKDLDNLDINYKVLSILHKNFREIRKDINMDEEDKKYRLRFLCKRIFKVGPGMAFKAEEKKELISLLKKPLFKSYFLITLSKQRTKGRFQRSETLLKDLSEILHFILDDSEKSKDFESAKNCIILSQTFYHEITNKKNKENKENKKIYLFEYIKNYKWLKSVDFWEGIIEFMIQNEIAKTEQINKKNNVNEKPEEVKSRLSNIGFSQVLSYTNNMMEFKINKEDINKVVDIFVKKYEIDPTMAEAIYENIKSVNQPEEDEEMEKYFKELEEKYEKEKEERKNNNDEDNSFNNKIIHRAQTITNKNKKGEIGNDTRSKSLKQKTTPFKDINKEKKELNNEINKEEEKNEENKDNMKVEGDKKIENNDENKIIENENKIEDIKEEEKKVNMKEEKKENKEEENKENKEEAKKEKKEEENIGKEKKVNKEEENNEKKENKEEENMEEKNKEEKNKEEENKEEENKEEEKQENKEEEKKEEKEEENIGEEKKENEEEENKEKKEEENKEKKEEENIEEEKKENQEEENKDIPNINEDKNGNI